jgi:hypothetical protein
MPSMAESDPKSRAWARFFVTSALILDDVETALKEAKLPPLAWYDLLWILENAEGGRMRMHELPDAWCCRATTSRGSPTGWRRKG